MSRRPIANLVGACCALLCALLPATATPVAHAAVTMPDVQITRPISIKISGELAQGGRVGAAVFTPDGTTVVFEARRSNTTTVELLTVPARGGPIRQLSATLACSAAHPCFLLTPDGDRVVYRNGGPDPIATAGVELFSIPIGGGAATKLSGPLPDSGNYRNVEHYEISADGNHVLFVAPLPGGNSTALFRVPITGGAPVQLSTGHDAPAFPFRFQLSADGSTAVYATARDIYAVPVADGPAVKLNDPIPANMEVDLLVVSSDGSRVVYRVVESIGGGDRTASLHSVPSGGGAVTMLAQGATGPRFIDLSPPNPFILPDVSITPDGGRVLFLLKESKNGPVELFSIPTGGGSATKLNPPLASTSGSLGVFGHGLAPDGNTVVFAARQALSEGDALYTVPAGGGTPVNLSGATDVNSRILPQAVSPDASRVVYTTGEFTGGEILRTLLVVPMVGGQPQQLGPTLMQDRLIINARFTPDGATVIYRAELEAKGRAELLRIPVAGGAPVKLNGPLTAGGEVTAYVISPDGATVVYRADQAVDNRFELFSVVDGGALLLPLLHWAD